MWLFTFEDSIHQRSAAALEALRHGTWQGSGRQGQRKLRVMMLTGDNEATARKVACELQIDEVRAGLSPQQKLQVSLNLLSTLSDAQMPSVCFSLVPQTTKLQNSTTLQFPQSCALLGASSDVCMHSLAFPQHNTQIAEWC